LTVIGATAIGLALIIGVAIETGSTQEIAIPATAGTAGTSLTKEISSADAASVPALAAMGTARLESWNSNCELVA
jgi:hypothetical protein